MRDATRQLAHGLHLLCLDQLVFEADLVVFRALVVRNVMEDDDTGNHFVSGIANRRRIGTDPVVLAVFVADNHFLAKRHLAAQHGA